MAIKKIKKSYELKLDFQVKINEDKELQRLQQGIEDLRQVFANHGGRSSQEGLIKMLNGSPLFYANVLGEVSQALNNAKLKSITEEVCGTEVVEYFTEEAE